MGHVFVVQSRLEHFFSDVVVIPTDAHFSIRRYWRPLMKGEPDAHKPEGWCAGSAEASRIDPSRWFIDVTSSPDDLARRLAQTFVRIAATLLETGERSNNPPRIALPVLGVGGGGQGHYRGQMVQILLKTAQQVVEAKPVDIVVAAIRPSDYAAIQAHRRDHFAATSYGFEDHAQALAKLAVAGHLALFIGAGASVPAGLPDWDDLLEGISGRLEVKVRALDDPLDKGELLRREFKDELGSKIAAGTDTGKRHALSHALLASLNCHEVVTTNFDQCFEFAVNRSEESTTLAVLPWAVPHGDHPWLLKMHGSRDKPKSIVVARRDFVRYQAEWGPAGAILQSLLMTRHLLFVGASLKDSNLLRLIHEVVAFRELHKVNAPMGTIVSLVAEPAREALLKGDFEYLSMLDQVSDPDLTAKAARRLEIFLDLVAMHASSSVPHLLDTRYTDLLTEDDEVSVAQALRTMLPRICELSKTSEAWTQVASALQSWGARDLT